ncbi:MAG: hypothetical protein KatS3mg110_2035 [Pirellulaceae bacterium]|nr:MAG: hypothetical protein KatS3mg110_2035 [Pirellulaceae bacterium]
MMVLSFGIGRNIPKACGDLRPQRNRSGRAATNRAYPRVVCLTMIVLIWGLLLVELPVQSQEPMVTDAGDLVLVVGAEGEPVYGEQFLQWAELWRQAACQVGRRVYAIGPRHAPPLAGDDRDELREQLSHLASQPTASPLWIVLIGHGTYNGRVAKFNLRGPDVSSSELAEWLKTARRPVIFVLSFSCSGAFVKDLAGPNRIILSATRSGSEIYFSRFGKFLAEVIVDRHADLDKNEEVSIFEVFLVASRRTEEFYRNEARLATEHAMLEDNGDGVGTEATDFRGYRPVKQPKNRSPDGALAALWTWKGPETETSLTESEAKELREWESALEQLRQKKHSMNEDEYYQELEKLLLQWIEKHPP